MKRTLCILLSLMLAMTGLVGLGVSVSATNVGDIIQFGNYPQTKVSETTALKNAANAATWKSYGYYIGNDSYDGDMAASDFMKYADFSLNGVKYRAVRFTQYRPSNTSDTSGANCSWQDENGYSTNTTYYFKYEPLEWRVLNPTFGLVMCETIIDSQAYQNVVRKSASDNYYIGTTATYANNYAESSIRTWLNDDFYNTAFNTTQKNKIFSTTSNNAAYSSVYSQYDAVSTTNPIFLLSDNRIQNGNDGFSDNAARKAKGTDYAKCQGLLVRDSGFSDWRLRSAGGSSNAVCNVSSNGVSYSGNNVSSTDCGIRPACCLMNLTSDVSQSMIYTVTATADPTAGGTVTGGGSYNSGAYATLTATPKSGWHFVGWYLDGTQVSTQQSFFRPVVSDLAYVAKFEKDSPTKNAKLNVPQPATVEYKSTVTVTATAESVPDGYFVALYDGDTQLAKGDNKTVSCTIKKMTGGKTLTAKIVNDHDEVQSNADGKLEKQITITVKTGFFDKVKAFFLGLFGLLPKVELKP